MHVHDIYIIVTNPYEQLAVPAAYLIGAIPFGYLTGKWLRGIDVRTLGSGNTGATNVGRIMGFRFFLLVFAMDLSKGLLPTWGFPRLVTEWSGRPASPELPVLVAVAAILGHNFPVYLKFKGGKGVATSLGAVFALDAWASLAASVGFLLALAVGGFVSLSSLIGGLVFVAVHFATTTAPWSRGQLALSVMSVALMLMLLFRHRKNLGRILAGTEPQVKLRRSKDVRSGKVTAGGLVALAVAGGLLAGAAWWLAADKRGVLRVGPYTVREVARVATGHQRVERVAFADGGRLLAVTCPRYLRVVLYRVTDGHAFEPLRDLELTGQPVALAASADKLFVLQRPEGDRRHVEPGWWDAFDFKGDPAGPRVPVGFYPDDLALTPDGRFALVLTSGRGEGDARKPTPALGLYSLDGTQAGSVAFEGQGDDPARLTLSRTGLAAVVTFPGAKATAAVDLGDPANPKVIGRAAIAEVERPYPSKTPGDSVMMPVTSGGEAVLLPLAGLGECVVATLPKGSAVELSQPGRRSLGRLGLRGGMFGLSQTRPTGLAFAPERGLIAVGNRSGGVHLLAIRGADDGLAAGNRRHAVR